MNKLSQKNEKSQNGAEKRVSIDVLRQMGFRKSDDIFHPSFERTQNGSLTYVIIEPNRCVVSILDEKDGERFFSGVIVTVKQLEIMEKLALTNIRLKYFKL